jgi:hypothetical protein
MQLSSAFLGDLMIDTKDPIIVGKTPAGRRMIFDLIGGRLVGPRINGKVLASGADWMLIRPDGSWQLDVRTAIELDDGAVVYATYSGRIFIPADVAPRTAKRDTVEDVDPNEYYFRTAPVFETASEKYGWLNRIQAVGVGRFTRTGVAYKLFEIT